MDVLNDCDHIYDSHNPMSLDCHLLYKDNLNSNKVCLHSKKCWVLLVGLFYWVIFNIFTQVLGHFNAGLFFST